MTVDLRDCVLSGAALTPDFVHDGLMSVIQRHALLPQQIEGQWATLRRSLRMFRGGGSEHVHKFVTTSLAQVLGYGCPSRQDPVVTRDGPENGGWMMRADGGVALRAWSVPSEVDLDAPFRLARRYDCSMMRIAQRVLRAAGERAGVTTNGDMLRLLLVDPSRADSFVSISLTAWREAENPPDSFRLLLALVGRRGLPHLSLVLDAARLHQTRITTYLRRQAREAITGFINAVLQRRPNSAGLDPAVLWQEGLVLVYRLLFILKLEASSEDGSGFSFASTRLWRTALSPNLALGPLVRRHLDRGADTGHMLEFGLRTVFALFRDGLCCSELHIAPLGGALFGPATMPLLDRLDWGEQAVAILLDRLFWTPTSNCEKARIHYGSLDVENLGRIYESLLEQEPYITNKSATVHRKGQPNPLPLTGSRKSTDSNLEAVQPGHFSCVPAPVARRRDRSTHHTNSSASWYRKPSVPSSCRQVPSMIRALPNCYA